MASTHFARTAAPILGLATLAVLGLAAAPAHAQITLNFDNLTAQIQPPGSSFIGNPYSDQGFTFTSTVGFDADAGSSFFGDGETSLINYANAPTKLAQDNGRTFSLNAIDLGPLEGNLYGTGFDGPVTFIGTKEDGVTVTDTVTLNDPNGRFQTFAFSNLTGLTSLTFTGDYNSGGTSLPQFDNVVLTPSAAVPEASTTMSFGLLLALGGLSLCAYKRKTGAS